MKSTFSFLFAAILFFFSVPLLAQDASNVQVSPTEDKLIVTYDLDGKKNKVYFVKLSFEKEDGSIIKPETLSGDIGKVQSGPGKAVVWDLYKDVDGLKGSILPIIDVKETVQPGDEPDKVQPTPTPPAPQKPMIDITQPGQLFKPKKRTHLVGFKFGLGSSSVDANQRNNDFKRRFSWEGGTFYRFNAYRRIAFQAEALYNSQTWEEIYNNTEDAFTRQHWLRGNLLASISPIGLGLYFNGGVYGGYLLGGKEKINLTANSTETRYSEYPVLNGEDLPYNKFDFGYVLGGSINVNKGRFALGFEFSQSFDSITNKAYYSGNPEREDLNLLNRNFRFYFQKSF